MIYKDATERHHAVEVADRWGRELAHEDLEKTAILGALGSIGKAIGANMIGSAVTNRIAKVGTPKEPRPFSYKTAARVDAFKEKQAVLEGAWAKIAPHIGSALGSTLATIAKTPAKRRMAIGAGAGAVMGGARHLLRSPEEKQRHSFLGSVAGGGIKGGIGGAVAGPASQHILDTHLAR